VTPLYKRSGSSTVSLRTKQNSEYRLSILNSRPEFLHIILTFVTARYKRLELHLSILNNIGSIDSLLKTMAESQWKFASIFSNTKPNSKSLKNLSKWLGRNPFLKKSEAKNLVRLSHSGPPQTLAEYKLSIKTDLSSLAERQFFSEYNSCYRWSQTTWQFFLILGSDQNI
jgi:hypothetical protein